MTRDEAARQRAEFKRRTDVQTYAAGVWVMQLLSNMRLETDAILDAIFATQYPEAALLLGEQRNTDSPIHTTEGDQTNAS